MSKTLPPLPDVIREHLSYFTNDAQCELTQAIESYALAAIEAQGVPDGWRELMSEALDNALASTVEEGISHDRRNYRRELAQRIKQALNASAPPAPQGVPDGWQLVPKEPPPEMIDAWDSVNQSSFLTFSSNAYAAMLASAPPAPQASVVQQEPVAWKHDCAALLTNGVELWIDACPHCGKPRSEAHPAPQAKPLTDEQIAEWWASENGLEDCDMAKLSDFTQVVRAVEARVIKGE